MSAAKLSYEQPIKPYYVELLSRYLQQSNDRPPMGWRRAVIALPRNATRVEPAEQDRFMQELLTLIRERCAAVDPKDISPQGLWIEEFHRFELVDKHIHGARLKVYPGRSTPREVWIDVDPEAGRFPGAGTFRS